MSDTLQQKNIETPCCIAQVAVELSLNRMFDYAIPASLHGKVALGSQVLVPFGHQKKSGYIIALKSTSDFPTLKEIHSVVGEHPLVNEITLKLARWMADYYVAPFEKALQTVIPGAVRKQNRRFKEHLVVTPTKLAFDTDAIKERLGKYKRRREILAILVSEKDLPLVQLIQDTRTTPATVRALEKEGFVTIEQKRVGRNPLGNKNYLPTSPLKLMPEQEDAYRLIKQSIRTGSPSVILLNGVTGSGKTEVYLQALAYAMERGKSAIILVPEISLTPQTVERFRSRFGDKVAVLHSHLSDGERHDEWHRLYAGEALIAIGARSALFAPMKNLGLIVVDEEHEQTYKQDKAPRYNARDVAVMRGHYEKCSVVLGTATPSLESYKNALSGKYAMAELTHRVDHRSMPSMQIVDMRIAARSEGKFHILSKDLVEAVRERLDGGEQTILFLNRRGFSSSLVCPLCGYVAECVDCSIAMTYHKVGNILKCHICGRTIKVPDRCPNEQCADPRFKFAGFGTQRIEEVVRKIFPRARVERMDSDTTTQKDAYERILGGFRAGKIDILIGTQMIAKGLHFPNVTLVGVINADTSLHMPDFRAGERTFQLLLQVAGRAGRGEIPGEVIVQTFTPFNASIQAARRLDFTGYADQEMAFREELNYPPFARLACITIRGKEQERVELFAERFEKVLRAKLSIKTALKGAEASPVARAKGYYRYQLIMRAPTAGLIVSPLRTCMNEFKWPKDVFCSIDMDAFSLM